jgi:hypothetical protein
MADATNTTKSILSVCATTSERVKDLVIKNGQLIFIQDACRIAMDWKNKRTFYNQIEELETDSDRANLSDAVNGKFYFVIDTAVLWRYYNGWIQITSKPDEILFIGTEMPELGKANTLYINKEEGNECISIWDDDTDTYKVVADKTHSISKEDIVALF